MRPIVFAFLAVGCVHVSSTPAGTTADGHQRFHIECNRSASHCYDRAAEVCPGGFDPVSEGSGERYGTINGQLVAVHETEMLVVCR